MVAIDGFARIIEEQYGQLSKEEAMEFIGIVRGNAWKLEKILDLWMDAARMEEGGVSIKPEAIVLPQALETTIREYQLLAKERGLQVNLVPSAKPIALTTDPLRLSQIVTNLLSNALKYTEKGAVSVRFEQEGSDVWIRVRDTGIGMSEDEASRVFERFYRIEHTKDKTHGHGLGLFIARQLAKALGGEITVASEPNQGTEFSVKLKSQ